MNHGHRGIHQLYQTLSRGARVRLLVAVSFIFAPAGVLQAPALEGRWLFQLAWIVYSVALAFGWAYAFVRNIRLLWGLIPLQILATALLSQWAPSELTLEDALCGVFIILGYVFLINFIKDEGMRHVRIRSEVALARKVQADLVPPVDSSYGSLQVFGVSSSSSEVGGDLLDVVEQGGQVGLYVADVTGHGVPASMLMSAVKGAIRMRLLASPSLDALLNDLNRVLWQISGSRMFVTLACIRIQDQGSAEYALAGHPPILHFRPSCRTLTRLATPGVPLGVLRRSPQRRSQTYECRQIELQPGDLLVLLTDGVTEVVNDQGEEFGDERIARLIGDNADLPLPELHALIIDAVTRHGAQQDDQTILLARV